MKRFYKTLLNSFTKAIINELNRDSDYLKQIVAVPIFGKI